MDLTQKTKIGQMTIGSVISGLIAATLTTIAASGLIAVLENKEAIWDNVQNVSVIIIHMLSSLIGCLIATEKGRGVVGAILTAALYCLCLLLMTVVAFGGKFESLLSGTLSIAAGMCIAILLRIYKNKRRGRMKPRRYSR